MIRPAVGWASVALVLALAGCTPPAEPGPAAPAARSASSGAVRQAPASVTLRALPSLATPKEIEPEQYGPPIEPEYLVGLDRIALQRAIGAPSLRRHEGEAEVWQYQGETCVMDAYLYAEASAGGPPRVTYVELRRGGVALLNQPDEQRRCYAEALAEGRRNAALGAKEP